MIGATYAILAARTPSDIETVLGNLRPELLHAGGDLLGGQHRDEAFAHARALSP